MQFIAVGQHAEGFIAIGQSATGVIAIGQVATGVIAIGQMARGVIAVGMLAFGLVSLGMLAGGLIFAAGMVGAGGRSGAGAIFPLVPVPLRRPKLPPLTTLDEMRASQREGWISARLRLGARGLPELVLPRAGADAAALPVTFGAALLGGAVRHAQLGANVVARVVPIDGGLRLIELKLVPRVSGAWLWRVVQLAGLAALAFAYWRLVLIDVGNVAIDGVRALLAGKLT